VFACAEGATEERCDALAVRVEDVEACKTGLACGEGDACAVYAESGHLCRSDGLEGRRYRRTVLVKEFDACDVALALVCGGEEFRLLVESVDDDAVVRDHVVKEHRACKSVCASQDEGDGEEFVEVHRMFDACVIGVSLDGEFASSLGAVIEPAAVRRRLFPSPFLVLGTVADKCHTDPDAVHFATGTLVFDRDGDALCAGQVRNLLEFDVCAAIVDGLVGHAHDEVDIFRIGLGRVCTELGVLRRGRANVRGGCGFAVVVPARHLVEGDDAFVSEVLLPYACCGLAYIAAVPARGFVPRHPPAPGGSVFVHLVNVRNWAVFAEGNDLVRAGLVREIDECRAVALVIVGLVVNVDAQHVIVGFARSPGHRGGILRVKVPNEVVDAVREDHAFVEQLVEGCELLARMRAPPEPVTTGFMERTEDGGNAFFLEVKENLGNKIDVSDESLVSGRNGIPVGRTGHKGFGEVEFGVIVVCAFHIEVLFVTRAPVPRECWNAALLPGTLGDVDGLFGVFLEPAVILAAAGSVHQVDSDEGGVLAASLEHGLNVFVLGGVTLGVGVHIAGHHAGNGLFAKVIDEEIVKLDCGRGGGLCHRGVAEVEGLGFVVLDFDVVHVDPAPAIGDGDGVLTGGKVHDRFDVNEFALVGHVERDCRGSSANFDVVDLGTAIIVHIVNDDGVFARFFDGNLRKSNVAAVHFDVLFARSSGACADGCVAREGCCFSFVLNRKCRACGRKAACEKGFFEIHVHSLNLCSQKYNEKSKNATTFLLGKEKICL